MKRQRIRRKIIFFMFLLFPITLNYFSPVLMTQATAERVASASLLVWAVIFLSSLVFGRAFCGYICPFHGLQLAWERVADKPLRRVRYLRALKYVLWGAWVGAVVTIAVIRGGWVRVDLLYMTPIGVSVDSAQSLVTYFMLVGITLAPMALGKRGFCHYICPFGVFGIVGTKIKGALRLPSLGLRAEPAACKACKACDRACPMSLPVSALVAKGDMRHTECILCGSCVDRCRDAAVSYSWRSPDHKG
jgi:ferredoxin-type protein NapH